MLRRIMTEEIAGYMVWLIEVTSKAFFGGDRDMAFRTLNGREIWHLYIDHYEVKRNLSQADVLNEIKEMLGMEKIPRSFAADLNDGDQEFIKAVVHRLAVQYNWNYSVTLDRFYASGVCRMLSSAKISLSAFSQEDVLALFEQEMNLS